MPPACESQKQTKKVREEKIGLKQKGKKRIAGHKKKRSRPMIVHRRKQPRHEGGNIPLPLQEKKLA